MSLGDLDSGFIWNRTEIHVQSVENELKFDRHSIEFRLNFDWNSIEIRLRAYWNSIEILVETFIVFRLEVYGDSIEIRLKCWFKFNWNLIGILGRFYWDLIEIRLKCWLKFYQILLYECHSIQLLLKWDGNYIETPSRWDWNANFFFLQMLLYC